MQRPTDTTPATRTDTAQRWRRARRAAIVAVCVAVCGTALTTVRARDSSDERRASPTTPSTAAPSHPTAPEARTVRGWTTTESGELLRDEIAVDEADAAGAALHITIDARVEFQTIDGFGAGMTHTSAALIAALPTGRRDELMAELFAVDGPLRLTYVRIPIGASDFVPSDAFTLDDVPPGETDWNLDRFSIERDREALIPVVRHALQLNPNLKVIAAPWSPPAWLKTNGHLQGGRLLDDPAAYRTYARYLVRFIEEYQSAGIPIAAISVQNEPQLRHPDGYPGTDMPVHQQIAVIEELGPALNRAGLSTAILGFDHNWSLHPADAATTPAGEDPGYQYPADLLRSPAARWLAGTAFHCYSGAAAAQSELHDQFPDKGIWVTECSGSFRAGDPPDRAFADTLRWQADNLLIDSLRHWARGVLTWNLALDQDGGPHVGGCATCTGVVTIHDDQTITRNAEYYLLGHASGFIAPGATRIASDAPGDSTVAHIAARNPDGTIVLVTHNPTDRAITAAFTTTSNGVTATADLPAHSLTTLTIS